LLTKEQLAAEFVGLFPQYQAEYDEHMADYGELLGHVFFGGVINLPLTALLKENRDEETIRRYVEFIGRMFAQGDDGARNIVQVTILEYLGDDDDVLQWAYGYFSDALIEESAEVEKSLGRREVILARENGKRLVRWESLLPTESGWTVIELG